MNSVHSTPVTLFRQEIARLQIELSETDKSTPGSWRHHQRAGIEAKLSRAYIGLEAALTYYPSD